MEKFFLTTKDSKKIAANFFDASQPAGWVLMIHMMPAVKESWNELSGRLQQSGYPSLAIDLRGHGESEGGPNGYRSFNDADHQASIHDLEAGAEFLKSRGAEPDKIILAGASIGANLALRYLAEHPESKKAILLSAGLNYRGAITEPPAKTVKADQKVLLASSEDDSGNPEMNRRLLDAFGEGVKKELVIYQRAGHGTTMLKSGEPPDLTEKIIAFLKSD